MLDIVFHDDLARLRTGYAPRNMAVIKLRRLTCCTTISLQGMVASANYTWQFEGKTSVHTAFPTLYTAQMVSMFPSRSSTYCGQSVPSGRLSPSPDGETDARWQLQLIVGV